MREHKDRNTTSYTRTICENCKRPTSAWHRTGKRPNVIICEQHICKHCQQPAGHFIICY